MRVKKAHTYTELLITMMFLCILFTMTIPTLNTNTSGQDNAHKLVMFSELLQSTVDEWKVKNFCPYKFGQCLSYQRQLVNKQPDFDIFIKRLKVARVIPKNERIKNKYLPLKTLNYFGNSKSEFDFRSSDSDFVLMLVDETVLSAKLDNEGIWLIVDVNGKKPPNRIGKDTFHFTLGYNRTSDISYYPKYQTKDMLCGLFNKFDSPVNCDPSNVDPYKNNGASPTAYIIINKKPVDFKELKNKYKEFK